MWADSDMTIQKRFQEANFFLFFSLSKKIFNNFQLLHSFFFNRIFSKRKVCILFQQFLFFGIFFGLVWTNRVSLKKLFFEVKFLLQLEKKFFVKNVKQHLQRKRIILFLKERNFLQDFFYLKGFFDLKNGFLRSIYFLDLLLQQPGDSDVLIFSSFNAIHSNAQNIKFF